MSSAGVPRFLGLGLAVLALVWSAGCRRDAKHRELMDNYAGKISSLVKPEKLATLGKRGANPRVFKYVALLADAQQAGLSPDAVADQSLAHVAMKGRAAKLTAKVMTRNLVIAERLGCLDAEGLQEMRKGQSPTIRRGPYRDDKLSVDHIIPLAVAPELGNVLANLELMPLRMNKGKSDQVDSRGLDWARKLHQAGLLSADGLRRVEHAAMGSPLRSAGKHQTP